jgi:hypothetical protein
MSRVYGVMRRPLGRGRKGCPSISTTGAVAVTRSGCTSTVPVPSATAVTSFRPAHRPHERDSATAWTPRSSASCTLPGYRDRHVEVDDGRVRADDGNVERLRCRVVTDDRDDPAVPRRAGEAAWRMRVAARSKAGPLPYQMPTTPS